MLNATKAPRIKYRNGVVLQKREQIRVDFAENDMLTRRAILRQRGLREMARPWCVTRHLMRYRDVRRSLTITFHQGARIQ